MKIILSFATEVAQLSEDHNFIKEIADVLNDEGLIANFHLTGDYARALKKFCRHDVVESLAKHEIGFHCNHHGAHPFMGKYLDDNFWKEGVNEWIMNENSGISVVRELFNRNPAYYTTEFAKAPQAVYGSWLLGLEITGYLLIPTRGHGAMWYCNSFVPNSENMFGPVYGLDNKGINTEKKAHENFRNFEEKIKLQKTDLLRLGLHSYKCYLQRPYTGINSMAYQNDELFYEDFKPKFLMRPKSKIREFFTEFRRTIKAFTKKCEYISYSKYRECYKDNAGIWVELLQLDNIANFLKGNLDACITGNLTVSPAEAFALFVRTIRSYRDSGKMPDKVFMRNVIGPVSLIPERLSDAKIGTDAIFQRLIQIDRNLDTDQTIPAVIDIGNNQYGPGQFLNGLIELYLAFRSNRKIDSVTLKGANFPVIAAEPFFKEETFTHGNLYPEGFDGKNICKMCRLQSWSWKPALEK